MRDRISYIFFVKMYALFMHAVSLIVVGDNHVSYVRQQSDISF